MTPTIITIGGEKVDLDAYTATYPIHRWSAIPETRNNDMFTDLLAAAAADAAYQGMLHDLHDLDMLADTVANNNDRLYTIDGTPTHRTLVQFLGAECCASDENVSHLADTLGDIIAAHPDRSALWAQTEGFRLVELDFEHREDARIAVLYDERVRLLNRIALLEIRVTFVPWTEIRSLRARIRELEELA